MKKIDCLQHVPFEGPGAFAALFQSLGCIVESRLVPQDGLPKSLGGGLLVMGGPMSVNDPDDWIRREREFIREAVARGIPVLGICLGSQFIASAMGGRVAPGPEPEIGLTSIRLTPASATDPLFRHLPPQLDVIEWHGEGIEAPPDATVLASSEKFPVQAFRVGRAAYGLLFHLELEANGLSNLCTHCASDLARVGRTAAEVTRDAERAAPQLREYARNVANAFVGLVRGNAP